jgi:hypothetical protein
VFASLINNTNISGGGTEVYIYVDSKYVHTIHWVSPVFCNMFSSRICICM